MRKQTFWATLGILVAIPLLPTIITILGNVFRGLGASRVDDWIYSGGSYGLSLLAVWSELELGGKAIAVLVVALVVAYIGFPLYRFAQGIISKENELDMSGLPNEYDSPEWKRHRLWLGAPAVWCVSLLYVTLVVFAFNLHKSLLVFTESNYVLVLWLFGGIGIVFLLLIARLFFGGLYSWIRNHDDDVTRRTGRNKFWFSFYYTIFLIILLSTIIMLASLNTARDKGSYAPNMPTSAVNESIGLAVGGANDINNFRENIENDYLPTPTDITHEGIFYDYTFDTGLQEECTDLFCPSYTTAVSPDPFSSSTEYFLSVGLNSGIKEEDFQRKKLNLVVVLDISGSMRSSFNRYYYDQFRTDRENIAEVEEVDNRSKMEIANESVVALLDHLGPEDRFGMVLFESSAYTAKGLRDTENTDMTAIKNHILEVTPRGGTNMEAGYTAGTQLLQQYKDDDQDEYENRIIFLTDAMPNTGQISEEGLFGLTQNNAEDNIYTTFIGIGVDFNTELINEITKTKGANYYSVHSAKDFTDRMDDGFDYMVTPLVFDLALNLESEGYEIRAVYGSPEADLSTGELMKVNTLFPSERTNEETRGGLVLLHLNKLTDDAKLKLGVSYENRSGEQFTNEQSIKFNDNNENEYYANTGIHKGVVLSRYVNVMKDWIVHEAELAPEAQIEIPIVRYTEEGIPIIEVIAELGRWERTSNRLTLSNEYYPVVSGLRDYLSEEINSIGDSSMEQEIEILEKIISTKTPTLPTED
jgi:Ca-activated chloride channel family protein